jgi:wyosine [tRNA(Phe)-imidazoG37] synthetase (radical SAM superfamily)
LNERQLFYRTDDVVEAVKKIVETYRDSIDYVTFMGDGEPTLALNLGEMAEGVRKFWKGKQALITNGSLFHLPEVRQSAMSFDVVSPTVSAGNERTFRRLHRPSRSLTLDMVIEGLKLFRKEFKGEIWAEIMLVKGVNDSLPALLNIHKVIHQIYPDRVYIGVPIRPPAESWVVSPTKETLHQAFEIFPGAIDMTEPEGPFPRNEREREDELVEIAKNHPLREDQAFDILSMSLGEEGARESLARLVGEGRLEISKYSGVTFYRVPGKKKGPKG